MHEKVGDLEEVVNESHVPTGLSERAEKKRYKQMREYSSVPRYKFGVFSVRSRVATRAQGFPTEQTALW